MSAIRFGSGIEAHPPFAPAHHRRLGAARGPSGGEVGAALRLRGEDEHARQGSDSESEFHDSESAPRRTIGEM